MPEQDLSTFVIERPKVTPMIYAYSDTNPEHAGMLKVGYTSVDVDQRVAEQFPVKSPDGKKPYKIVFRGPAIRPDGSTFRDHAVHQALIRNPNVTSLHGEWFKCSADDVHNAWYAVMTRNETYSVRDRDFSMRPEQEAAVEKTIAYFKSLKQGAEAGRRIPKFLWNAKMRFGKTFATYQLARRMGFKRILILTFKPAVQTAWREDIERHVDFEGWQFISRPSDTSAPNIDEQYAKADKSKPIVCFGSFQDFLRKNDAGGIKTKNEWVHTINWDLVAFDEYHFGAWRDNAKKLFMNEDEDSYDDIDLSKYKAEDAIDETWLPITTDHYLFLSGTPFRALASGEFIEEQIFSWTYSDEQSAKARYFAEHKGEPEMSNPYAPLPRMIMLTYKMPEEITRIAQAGEFDEFDLNEFFAAEGTGRDARFKHEAEVQKWLDLIRGAHLPTEVDSLKQGARPPMPFSDTRLMNVLSHTLWFLPYVASCHAMANLLAQRQNGFYRAFDVIVCAGTEAGTGAKALENLESYMTDPLNSRTITLSCGKLVTGVTVKPWTGIFMLKNLNSPETYFQAAFRVQSPWVIDKDDAREEIMKRNCYVFDFALNRALRQISDYACSLDADTGTSPEKKVAEFMNFLPVLAYDGFKMVQISAGEVLDIAMSGTTATLLARRWESALLVNVDNDTLKKLMANEEAMEALMRIEDFRNLNADVATIINKSESVKNAKKEDRPLTQREKQRISDEEKEFKSKRKEIQDKLIKLATRIPVFMFLTDYREETLKDVITNIEPKLFKKATGLEVREFNLLCELDLFNSALMNSAVFNFKRYEDASLSYTGIESLHAHENVGGFDTVLTREQFDRLYGMQQLSMTRPTIPAAAPQKVTPKPKSSKTPRPQEAEPTHKVTSEPPTAAPQPITPRLRDEDFDPSSVSEGMRVYHKGLGMGRITKIEHKNGYIYIEFGGNEKLFMFPGAFIDGFLSVEK